MWKSLSPEGREVRRKRCIFCGQRKKKRARGRKFVDAPEVIAISSNLQAPNSKHACRLCAEKNVQKLAEQFEAEAKL
jgi:hypothetical protein